MKKLACILMAAILMCSLAACTDNGGYETETQQAESAVDTEVQQESNEDTAPEVPESEMNIRGSKKICFTIQRKIGTLIFSILRSL